jgi:hypothetical protein
VEDGDPHIAWLCSHAVLHRPHVRSAILRKVPLVLSRMHLCLPPSACAALPRCAMRAALAYVPPHVVCSNVVASGERASAAQLGPVWGPESPPPACKVYSSSCGRWACSCSLEEVAMLPQPSTPRAGAEGASGA